MSEKTSFNECVKSNFYEVGTNINDASNNHNQKKTNASYTWKTILARFSRKKLIKAMALLKWHRICLAWQLCFSSTSAIACCMLTCVVKIHAVYLTVHVNANIWNDLSFKVSAVQKLSAASNLNRIYVPKTTDFSRSLN